MENFTIPLHLLKSTKIVEETDLVYPIYRIIKNEQDTKLVLLTKKSNDLFKYQLACSRLEQEVDENVSPVEESSSSCE